MALPSSGAISLNNVNVELGLTATAQISMNDAAVRTLFGVASGAIGMNNGYGKSNRVSVTVTLASNTTDYTLGTAQIPGYIAGKTDVTLVVDNGVYVYSTNTANAGLTIATLNAADTVSIVNNGYIIGMGGAGVLRNNGTSGGPALSITRNITITNNSYIAGGGGGGGGLHGKLNGGYGGSSGGGGAGGGSAIGGNGGTDGGPGEQGTTGVYIWNSGAGTGYAGGGGGGRILPGVGGPTNTATHAFGSGTQVLNNGGGAGGAGGAVAYFTYPGIGQAGGSANNPGTSATDTDKPSTGGGGGWGAKGGDGPLWNSIKYTGGAGGKAVNLNGFTVTWLATGTRWGAIS